MASTQTNSREKKLQYVPVDYDANEIPPDAPEGEWGMSIPRGKCKVQPTREDRFPMIIVPIRLDSTEEEGEEYQKALGTELSLFLVFGSRTPRGDRLGKLRVRELAELCDADLDLIPKRITGEDDLQPFIKAIEGKKFTAWTRVNTRKETGEEVADVVLRDPNRKLAAASDEDDDAVEDDEEEEAKPRAVKKGAAKKNGKGRR